MDTEIRLDSTSPGEQMHSIIHNRISIRTLHIDMHGNLTLFNFKGVPTVLRTPLLPPTILK